MLTALVVHDTADPPILLFRVTTHPHTRILAMAGSDSNMWEEVESKVLESLRGNSVYTECRLPPG